MSVQRAILLAAGRGTRLGALTADRPKPMVPMNGKPVLEHILRNLERIGLREFVMVVGYRAEVIQSYFGDGSAWNWRISYVRQEVPNGTGAALALGYDPNYKGACLSSYGDILTEISNYQNLIADFMANPCAAQVAVNYVEDVSAGSSVDITGNLVVKVTEKPPLGTATSNWNLAGVNIFGPEVRPALDALKPSVRGEYELTDAISHLIADGKQVRATRFTGFWSDIGTPEALADAEANVAAASHTSRMARRDFVSRKIKQGS